MNTKEIKAGQRWRGSSERVFNDTVQVLFFGEKCVLLLRCKDIRFVLDADWFLKNYTLIPEPKTRPITKDDVMKMLAVNSTLWFCRSGDDWGMITASTWLTDMAEQGQLKYCKFSHNPFATNPVIVGPTVPCEGI